LLLELTADASDALLGHTISSSSLGLDVAVAGFSQKLPRLLLLTVDDEARFELVKNLRIRNLNNMSTRQPCELSHDDVHAILLSSALDLGTNIALVKQVRLADLRLFAKRFLGGEVLERLQKQQSDQVSVSLWEKLSQSCSQNASLAAFGRGEEGTARDV
jgi:secreted Zn-dependent insulinase-like peptidase